MPHLDPCTNIVTIIHLCHGSISGKKKNAEWAILFSSTGTFHGFREARLPTPRSRLQSTVPISLLYFEVIIKLSIWHLANNRKLKAKTKNQMKYFKGRAIKPWYAHPFQRWLSQHFPLQLPEGGQALAYAARSRTGYLLWNRCQSCWSYDCHHCPQDLSGEQE